MFDGFQFPKTILTWIESHPGTAGWVQAVGAITIILATVHIAGADRRDRQRKERLEREGTAVVLLTELIAFRGILERAGDSGSVADAIIETTPMLLRNAERLHTLGEGGGALLQMLSSLSANNIVASELLRKISEGKITNEQAWPHVAEALRLNLEACDQAIVGLKTIVKL
jgi:hypothetical protein